MQELQQRDDYRLVCLDRNGEFTTSFYRQGKDLLFNPTDSRSVGWCHSSESASVETIAAGIVPFNSSSDPFWPVSARNFLSEIYQRCFNEFDGREIVEDLAKYDNLWRSFIFSRPLYLDDEHGLGFSALIEVLLIMGNRKPTAETIFPQEFVYPGDTLFVLARNADTIVSQLMDLGKKWRASEIFIYDGCNREFKPDLQQILHYKLNHSLWGESGEDWEDAVVMSFWWD